MSSSVVFDPVQFTQELKSGTGKFAQIGFDGEKARLGWVGAVDYALAHPELLEAIERDAADIKKQGFRYAIFSGMGGSSLAVKTMAHMRWGQTPKGSDPKSADAPEIFVLDSTDPKAINDVLRAIAARERLSLEPRMGAVDLIPLLKKTVFIPVSKSSTTEETLSHLTFFENLYANAGFDPARFIRPMTDPGSKNEAAWKEKGYPVRSIQLDGKTDIGGRFSAPGTRVFLLPLALRGVPLRQTLEEAKRATQADDPARDPYLRLAEWLVGHAAEGRDKMTLLLPREIFWLGPWAEQLFEESLGKDGKGILVFYGEDLNPKRIKPKDKNDRVFVTVKVAPEDWGQTPKGSNPNFAEWVKKEGYPVFEISLPRPEALAGAMMGFQRTVAAVAYLWGINFVNQPAVESYKKKTREILSQRGQVLAFSHEYPKFHQMAKSQDLTPSRWEGVEYFDIRFYGEPTAEVSKFLEDQRRVLLDRFKMPVKIGIGPGINHAGEQLSEDGPNTGLFILIASRKHEQMLAGSYDGVFLTAQALGTKASLEEKGRRVAFIFLDDTAPAALEELRRFFETSLNRLEKL